MIRSRPVPDETISRLLCYLRALLCLAEEGVQVVSSQKLAEACRLKPSMVRKDLSYFGEYGTRGVGYAVNPLVDEIRGILKLDKTMNAALVGVGNIGRALLLYPGFAKEGFRIALAFDNDPERIGERVNDVSIEDIAGMEERIEAAGIRLALVAVPVAEAPQVARRLASAGVSAILSFAPCHLNMPEDVTVTCVDLAGELARLVYYL